MQDVLEAKTETAETLPQQLHAVEELTNELKRLLVQNEDALCAEGIKPQVETVERWLESYRRGLAAANKLSDTGLTWLTELRDKLKLSADEQQRLEGEGGNPANKEQAKKAEELLQAIRRLEEVIPTVAHLVGQADPSTAVKGAPHVPS